MTPQRKKKKRRGKRLGRPETLKRPLTVLPTPEPDRLVDISEIPLRASLRNIAAVAKLGRMVPDELEKSLKFSGQVRDDPKVKIYVRQRATDTSVTICKHINEVALEYDKAQAESNPAGSMAVVTESKGDGTEGDDGKTKITITVN